MSSTRKPFDSYVWVQEKVGRRFVGIETWIGPNLKGAVFVGYQSSTDHIENARRFAASYAAKNPNAEIRIFDKITKKVIA